MQYQPLYTVSEVAKILKMNVNAVYSEMNKGNLPYILLGSKKVRGKDLEKFIDSYPNEKVEGSGQADV